MGRRDGVTTLTRRYLLRLPPARHDRANETGTRSRVVAMYPSRCDIERIRRSSTAGTCVLALTVNPDTWQVETVKVDEMTRALCLMDAFHLRFTSSKQLFMLEPASVTTDEADSCISPLGRRFSVEWWMWWVLQQSGQQQCGQLFRVLVVVRVVVAVLTSAIGSGPEVAER